MAGEVVSLAAESGRAWLREGTRATILDAARKLFNQGGMDKLSLSAVAAETGFAPPTVYAYFTNKNDLLVATVANDLADLARAMRDVYPFPDQPSVESEAVHDEPVEQIAEFVPEPEHTMFEVPSISERPPEPPSAPLFVQEEVMREPQLFDDLPDPGPVPSLPTSLPAVGKKKRLLERREAAPENTAQKPELPTLMPHPDRVEEEVPAVEPQSVPPEDEIAAPKQIVAKPELPKIDVWLERRLRVFEKSLSDIETRLGTAEQNSTRASALADETSKILAQRVEGVEKRLRDGLDSIAQRFEQSEKRPRGMPPDLRATINDLYARLETIETGHSNPTSVAELEAQWAAPVETPPDAAIAPAESEKPITAAAETYLTAARRAANAAAQLAQIETKPRRIVVSRKRLSRTNLIVALCGALALLLVVYGFILRDYFVSQSQAPAHPVSAAHHVTAIPVSKFDGTRALADHGNVSAELALGLDYLNGSGAAKNPGEAARWLQVAAEGGEPVGQYWFGTLYERGLGVRADSSLAFHWYQRAAMQGNRRAMYNVAIAYAMGRGVARDMGQAADWFRRAADLGYVDAEYNLGVLYERGDGVPQSLLDAYKWYAVAAAVGDSESKSRIAALATQLSPNDLSAAQSAASSFKPEPLNRAANLMPSVPARG